MALPILSMLGLASGALNVVQKALGQGNAKGGFDAELSAALTGKAGSSENLSKMLMKNGELDEDALNGILGTSAGFLLFQFMTALKDMGLQSSDMKLLLSGNGAQMSDGALQALLSTAGVGQKEIESILADASLKSETKVKLADSFKEVLEAQAGKEGVDLSSLLEMTASDIATIDEILERIEQAAPSDLSKQAAQAGADTRTAASDDSRTAFTLGLIQRNVSHATNEIRAMISQVLKEAEKAEAAAETVQAGPETAVKVSRMAEVAESTFGITKDALRDLFFETDPQKREQAVEEVARQVNSYLKNNEGKQLSPEVMHTLSFLKKAMSDTEFAGIDGSFKLWGHGQTVPDLKMPVDRDMYASLTKNLANADTASQFDSQMKQVVDQLRQALPSRMGTGEGQVTLKLHPPMLGQVDVSMTMADGQLQAVFKTDQAITRDMLVQNMNILKDALADQGIKAAQFSVSMSFDQRQGQDGYAFTNHDKGGQGLGHQGRGNEGHDRAYKTDDTALYARAGYTGASDAGLDLFA